MYRKCFYHTANKILSYTFKADISLLTSVIYKRLFTLKGNNITKQEELNVEEESNEYVHKSEFTKI